MQQDDKKAIFGWSMYDWANSAFATTVMAGFFPVFFKQFWNAGVDTITSTARLGLANSLAGIVIVLIAPMLGAIADKGRAKKKFLFFFAYMGIAMTVALYLVAEGHWVLAFLLYIFATIGFSGSNIFYDSLLTAVASPRRSDFVSSLGFSLGYLGGGLLFAVNVWMVLRPETFGLADTSEAVKLAFLSVGVWWAIFSLPLFFFVKEPELGEQKIGLKMVEAGYRQLKHTFQEIRHLKTIFLFLAAYWLYIDGVDTIIRMAVDYGLALGFDQSALIIALLITQFVGFPAAIGFGYLAGKIGTKPALFIGIAVYLFVAVWGAFIREQIDFYILAIVVGLVQGGVQALSRSYYSRLIPANKSAEFFGFYNMLGKFAVVIGPVLIAGTGLLIQSLGFSDNTASRISISSVSLLFIAGGILLYFVNEQKGKQEAQYLSGKS